MLVPTPEELSALLEALPSMPRAEQEALLADLDELEHQQQLQRCRDNFLAFCHRVYPHFKEGPHHRHLAPILHEVLEGVELRLTVSMAPRFGKSITISYLFVAWYLGHNPDHHIMMVTHTADLSADFGRLVRNMIESPVYRELFPDTAVSRDKSAASNWSTTLGGKYLAIGIGGNVAGHGAHLLIGDDLVSEQSVLASDPDKVFAQAWEYMQVGPLQRLMPNGKIIVVGTRWGKKDPIGRALKWAEENKDSLPWHEVRFPAVLPSGKSLWPEQWPVEQLMSKKAGMFPQFWAAQYMQEPTSEEGALIKREWWRTWTKTKPPKCDIIMQSWDTAHETKSASDPSGVMTWGVWFNEETQLDNLILLDAWTDRKEFPALKKFAMEYYKEWEPDMVIIEKKAAGAPLIQEFRAAGIPVQEYSPSRGADKRVRVNSVADIFASGLVWAPETRWAKEVIDQIAEFPNSDHDEYVDCFVAGTQIQLANGQTCAIEQVNVGEMVATPFGARMVTAAWCSGRHPVVQVRVGDATLCGTGNHPIFVGERWIALDKLEVGVHTGFFYTGEAQWPSDLQECVSRASSLLDANTIGIQTLNARRTATTSHAPAGSCTATSGRTITGLFQRACSYTTKMRTRAITILEIWSASLQNNIGKRIAPPPAQSSARTLTALVYWRRSGISPRKAELGIGSTQRTTPERPTSAYSPTGTYKNRLHAAGVAQMGWLQTSARNSAAQPVRVRNPSSAAVSLSASTCTTRTVFNLEVEGAHCYFANGVLVHNCTSQALMRFRAGGFIRLESDVKDDTIEPRRRREYY